MSTLAPAWDDPSPDLSTKNVLGLPYHRRGEGMRFLPARWQCAAGYQIILNAVYHHARVFVTNLGL